MSEFQAGQVIRLRPTRQVFATSSGSWSGNPAHYNRPVIVTFSQDGDLCIAPLLGAKQRHGRWGPKPRMTHEWWNPVDMINFHGPPRDDAQIARAPIRVRCYQQGLPQGYHFKPSYVWVGDSGQWFRSDEVNAHTVQSLDSAYQLASDALQSMAAQNAFWARYLPPPY
ncbi:hypothetical protein OE88DRAFT_1733798 [Heliocybe sulcata]|uniref:Uncharacterized protein n=1 Tax=Heliocybe sulcata TaxID=5364 RepID=A0A5C3N8L8_9AGAM|nr:hypothetical protein OE88DRAFT_1733798 [Heliocybe sulcata]